MSKEYLIVNKGDISDTDLIANQVTIDPRTEEIQFHGNSKHNYNGLLKFLNIVLKTAVDENHIRPKFSIKENPENNTVTTQGDCEYIVNVCKEQNLFDEETAIDMLNYLNNSRNCSIL